MGGKFKSTKFLLEKYSGISQIANWMKKVSGVYSCSCILESAISTWKKILLMAIIGQPMVIPWLEYTCLSSDRMTNQLLNLYYSGQFCARKNVLVQWS